MTTEEVTHVRLGPGARVGAYRLHDELGRGGAGVVFQATDERSGDRVALKVVRAAATREGAVTRRRFRVETAAVRGIVHPNVVRLLDSGESPESAGAFTCYYAMELVAGRSLHQRVMGGGPFPLGRAVDVMLQAARGLQAAHARDVLHRDIKPQNLLLDESGRVVLLDFGICKPADVTGITRQDETVGTARYLAPELFIGEKADVRVDIFGLGAVLYFLLAGEDLRTVADLPALYRVVHENTDVARVAADTRLPAAARTVILRCVARDPAERYPDVAAFMAALGAIPQEELTADGDWNTATRPESTAVFGPTTDSYAVVERSTVTTSPPAGPPREEKSTAEFHYDAVQPADPASGPSTVETPPVQVPPVAPAAASGPLSPSSRTSPDRGAALSPVAASGPAPAPPTPPVAGTASRGPRTVSFAAAVVACMASALVALGVGVVVGRASVRAPTATDSTTAPPPPVVNAAPAAQAEGGQAGTPGATPAADPASPPDDRAAASSAGDPVNPPPRPRRGAARVEARNEAKELVQKAVAAIVTGDINTAHGLLTQALRLDPSNADAYKQMGIVLTRQGRPCGAVMFLQRYQQLAPGAVDARLVDNMLKEHQRTCAPAR